MKATRGDADVLTRILLEVTLGKPPARPDTPEQAAYRQQLQVEVALIALKGGVVDVPSELA